MNIALTGMMGSGKTAIGKILAEKLRMRFFDMDTHIEKTAQKKIKDIFADGGEALFRQMERELVKCLSALDGLVISTGGGIVLNGENINDLRKKGKIVYLKAKPEILFERIQKDKNRPLLNVKDPLAELRRIYGKRKKFYADCDICVDTAGREEEEICAEIAKKIKAVRHA
ncbi:MAG: shikimate kinase [Elusimicrobia bacterium HGW-Elusimicrobia-2]|nr:MAG: shikimate kinase [Elusimicrobia bacterium HGW-Elusimicrobia-2]